MPSILDTPPAAVQANLNELINELDIKIPRKQLDHNLLIATWNIRAFGDLTRKWVSSDGDSPKRDLHSVLCIAEIIKRFDVIAIQEVKANIRALRDTLKYLGDHWSMVLTDVTKGSAGNGERMAYLFDTRRVKMSGLACELTVPNEWINQGVSDDSLSKQFARTPYAVSFKSGNKTFILVTLHILYGANWRDRVPELKGIAKWIYEWAKDVNAYHQNLICLGDFNIDKRGDLLHQTFIEQGLYIPDKMQESMVTRSIFDETKYYDHIAWFKGSANNDWLSLQFKTGGNFDFVQLALRNRNLSKRGLSWRISDHYPLWAEFWM